MFQDLAVLHGQAWYSVPTTVIYSKTLEILTYVIWYI